MKTESIRLSDERRAALEGVAASCGVLNQRVAESGTKHRTNTTTMNTTTARNAYESIVHEYAVECADREGSKDAYTAAVEKITRDDAFFTEYCEDAEMTSDEIAAALALKA